MMPGDLLQRRQLRRAFRQAENGENMLDTCARRVLQMVLKTRSARGLQATGDPHLEEHARLARRAAAESFVLLHNEGGALPFSPEARVALFGASSYDLVAGGTGSGHVNAAYKMNLSDALPHCVGARLIAEYRRWAQGNTHRNKAAGFGFMQKFLGRGALKERSANGSRRRSIAPTSPSSPSDVRPVKGATASPPISNSPEKSATCCNRYPKRPA